MDKHFPPEMIAAARESYVKKAFISDIHGHGLPGECENCGGLGTFVLFLATDGPYQEPLPSKDKTAHWYNNYWWMGKTYEFKCPDCQGLGYYRNSRQVFVAPPEAEAAQQMQLLAERLEG